MRRHIVLSIRLLLLSLLLPELSIASVTEQEFNQVFEEFVSVYTPLVKDEFGATLDTTYKWKSEYGTARAEQSGNYWFITIGGRAFKEVATKDVVAMVACHELGHHIGGAPKKTDRFKWSSVEGQADYFATSKCMRNLFANDDNLDMVSKLTVPRLINAECSRSFPEEKDRAVCIRISIAAIDWVKDEQFDSLFSTQVVDISTPDTTAAKNTLNEHPALQCRLDTLIAGAICPIAASAKIDQRDPDKGFCSTKTGFLRGIRPNCWYKE